jgi:hypothetical protein
MASTGTLIEFARTRGGNEIVQPPLQVIDEEIALRGVMERIGKCGIKIDETGNFFRVSGTNGAELLAGDGVAGHDGAVELERSDDGELIVVGWEWARWRGRSRAG